MPGLSWSKLCKNVWPHVVNDYPMPPQVSILLPAWNAAATLLACLRSIVRQTWRHWQCLIVDDGSSDATLSTAQAFAASDSRFQVLSTSHRGIVAALNTGLAACQGDYIARMDADDLMHRQRLALQVQALEHAAHVVATGCHVRLWPRRSLRQGRLAYECWLNHIVTPQQVRQEAFIECPIAHPTLMIRRDILQELRYRDCGWPEDYDLLLRLLQQSYEIGMVPRRLLSWRDAPQRLSRTSSMYSLASFTACKAAFLIRQFLASSSTYILWGYGDTGKALCQALRQYGKKPAYIIEVHPGRLGQRIHGAAVIPPAALPTVPRLPVLVSVAGEQARTWIRQAMQQMGWRELEDFVCAA